MTKGGWLLQAGMLGIASVLAGCTIDREDGSDSGGDAAVAERDVVSAGEAQVGAATRAQRTPSADGVEIAYEVFGDPWAEGPPLVLVHGWSCDRSYWDAQVGPLSERHRVVTVDLAGHGESGMDRKWWTIASYGADVAAVLEVLDLHDAVLVGHSMGGDVIVDAARAAPDRVAGLVWVDAYRELGQPFPSEEIEAFVGNLESDFQAATYAFVSENLFPAEADADLVDRVSGDMAEAPPEVALPSILNSFQNGHLVPVVLQTEIDVPIVAINPADGTTDAESLGRYGVDVELLPGVGHFLMMEDPAGFNELLLRVLERWGAPSG